MISMEGCCGRLQLAKQLGHKTLKDLKGIQGSAIPRQTSKHCPERCPHLQQHQQLLVFPKEKHLAQESVLLRLGPAARSMQVMKHKHHTPLAQVFAPDT